MPGTLEGLVRVLGPRMVPRRHRSLVYKLLIAVPILWILLVMFFYEKKSEVKEEVKEAGVRRVQAEARVEKEGVKVVVKEGVKEGAKAARAVEDPIDNLAHDASSPGELGKPVKVESPDKETKAAIDKGWQVGLGRGGPSNGQKIVLIKELVQYKVCHSRTSPIAPPPG